MKRSDQNYKLNYYQQNSADEMTQELSEQEQYKSEVYGAIGRLFNPDRGEEHYNPSALCRAALSFIPNGRQLGAARWIDGERIASVVCLYAIRRDPATGKLEWAERGKFDRWGWRRIPWQDWNRYSIWCETSKYDVGAVLWALEMTGLIERDYEAEGDPVIKFNPERYLEIWDKYMEMQRREARNSRDHHPVADATNGDAL